MMTETTSRRNEAKEILAWLRRNLLLIIFCGMLVLQFLTWRAVTDLRRYFPGEPPECDSYHPCHVIIDRP